MKYTMFGLALIIGGALAGDINPYHHHHHHHLGYRGYAPVLSAGPAVIAKSAPVLVSKAVPAVAAVPAYAAHAHAHSHAHSHAHAPVAYVSGGVGIPAHAHAYATPLAEHVALLSAAGKPKVYGQSIPAAAVRNVETVMVTKTITPVVTKTTTHHTHAEPALSLGHVQGYNQAAIGHPKIAPVQFNTAYTTYANPTVGVNGPVVYSGPAFGLGAGLAGAGLAGAGLAVKAAPAVAAVAHPAALYKGAAISPYTVLPGSALSLSPYHGFDGHSVPVTNFLELKSGKPVFAAAHAHGHQAHAYGL